jgi:hypothetical protein
MYSKIATWKKHDEPSKSSNPTIKSRVPMGTPSWTKKNGVTPQLQIVRKAGEVHRPTWVWNNIARVVLLFAWHQEIYVHFGCGLRCLKCSFKKGKHYDEPIDCGILFRQTRMLSCVCVPSQEPKICRANIRT